MYSYLVRHGEAVPEELHAERSLSDDERAAVVKLANHVASLGRAFLGPPLSLN